MYEERTYRGRTNPSGLVPSTVLVKETDLFLLADKDVSAEARESVLGHRHKLEAYITKYPGFASSLVPVKAEVGAPKIVMAMAEAGRAAGVGPMAAVAGTISELVGEDLSGLSEEVIVENGGDIYIRSAVDRRISLYAGDSPLSEKVGLLIRPQDTPLGVCTSSGKVGHSLSMGSAHAVCIVSRSCALADAAATSAGNVVKGPGDVEAAIDFARRIEGVLGVVVIAGDRLGAWGKVELIKL